MPFGEASGVGRGTGVLDGVVIVEGKGAVLGMDLRRPIVTNGILLRSCARAMPSSQITLGRLVIFYTRFCVVMTYILHFREDRADWLKLSQNITL